MMDRAGLAGPDGPTHHGVFDIGYMRVFPNMVLMAPADQTEMEPMLEFAIHHSSPVGIRYPKATAHRYDLAKQPIELGKGQVVRWGTDGAIVACGAMLEQSLQAADRLAEEGLNVAVINARFIKPLDTELLGRVFEQCRFIITVEEGALQGGFGSAVLEAACANGWDTRKARILGIPDRFIEHGERNELLAEIGIDAEGIAKTCRMLSDRERTLAGTYVGE